MQTERRTADEQYRLIMECRSSGLSDFQWCNEHGIKPGTFYNWVKRLRKKSCYGIQGVCMVSNIFSDKSYLISIILTIIKSVIILLTYIYFDKKQGKKRSSIEYVAIFIFCDFYVIYNVIKKFRSKMFLL